jgi:cellulose synthase (UDP-forming)
VPRLLVALALLLGGTLIYALLSLVGWTPTTYPLRGLMLVPLVWIALTLAFVVAGIRRIRDPRFSTERREGHRFPAGLLATVTDAPARVIDVSLGGAQVRVQGFGTAVGDDVLLAVTVPDRSEPVVFRATVRSRQGDLHRLQFIGRQWIPLAALSATAFGAGAARWAAAREHAATQPGELVVPITTPVPVPPPAPAGPAPGGAAGPGAALSARALATPARGAS